MELRQNIFVPDNNGDLVPSLQRMADFVEISGAEPYFFQVQVQNNCLNILRCRAIFLLGAVCTINQTARCWVNYEWSSAARLSCLAISPFIRYLIWYFLKKILRGIKTNQILALETTSVCYFNTKGLSNDDSTQFLIHYFCTHVESPQQLGDTR